MGLYLLTQDEISEKLAASRHLLLGVSGGADSMFLLLALTALKGEFGWTISVAHINHGLRPNIADEEEEFVKSWAEYLKLPFYVNKADVKAVSQMMKKGDEAAGRQVRYDFYFKIAEKIGADALVLGHQEDDQIENFFLRLLRGASPGGLLPLSTDVPINDNLALFRPLLNHKQRDIKEILDKNCINYCEDESNYSGDYKRTMIRQELLPFLLSENPKLHNGIKNLQKQLADDQAFINYHLEQKVKELDSDPLGFCSAGLNQLQNWPQSLLSRWLNDSFYQIAGDQEGIQFIHIEEILNKIYEAPVFWQNSLPQGIVAMISCNRFFLLKDEEQDLSQRPIVNWSLPQKNKLPYSERLEDYSCWLKIEEITWPKRKRGGVFGEQIWDSFSSFQIRTFQPGDRISIKGNKSKKLSDYFQERRLPLPWRQALPLLTKEDRIVLIPDHYCSQQLQPQTGKRCYHLSIL